MQVAAARRGILAGKLSRAYTPCGHNKVTNHNELGSHECLSAI